MPALRNLRVQQDKYVSYPAKKLSLQGGHILRMYTGVYARTLSPHFFRKLRENGQKTWSESDMGAVLSGRRVYNHK